MSDRPPPLGAAMAVDFTADLAFVLQDTGVAVTFGSQRTYGQVDVADEAMFAEAQVYGVKRTLLIKTGSLTGVVVDSTLVVGGTSYRVMAPTQRLDEGGTTRVLLGTV